MMATIDRKYHNCNHIVHLYYYLDTTIDNYNIPILLQLTKANSHNPNPIHNYNNPIQYIPTPRNNLYYLQQKIKLDQNIQSFLFHLLLANLIEFAIEGQK